MRLPPTLCALMLTAAGLTLAGSPAPAQPKPTPAARKPNAARLNWWRNARFGMFIHWGPVSLKGTEIGWSRGSQVPIEEYDSLYKRFNPVKFNADAWVKIAKAAGMKYIVFTTKHHDGFCMFNTEQTDYNIMHSPFGRDVVKELADACRATGLAFGAYYSVCDWRHPDFPLGSPGGATRKPYPDLDAYERYLRAQVRELIQNYGPLLVMWFDVAQEFDAKRGKGVVDYVRSLQPDILVNNRCVDPGDFDTPEQTIGTFQTSRPWESCITICNQWAWKPGDTMKSLEECVQTLVRCAGGDGNLLLNVGPMPTGEIEPRQVQRLKEMGEWLRKYGRSVYSTRGGPYKPGTWGCSTHAGSTIYLHVFDWGSGTLSLPPLGRKVLSASVLTGGSVTVRQTADALEVTAPVEARKPIDTVVCLRVQGSAATIKPISVAGSLTTGKRATASNVYANDPAFSPDKAVDDDESTRWATDGGTHSAWLEVDLGQPTLLGNVRVLQEPAYAERIQRFELQVEEGGAWRTILSGTTMPADYRHEFAPVTTRRIRLNIPEATEGPTINEFQLFPPKMR